MLNEFEGGLFRRIREGQALDDGWGYVYFDPMTKTSVAAPIPWNILAAAIRRVYLFLLFWPMTWGVDRLNQAYEKGRKDGIREEARRRAWADLVGAMGQMGASFDDAARSTRKLVAALSTAKRGMGLR